MNHLNWISVFLDFPSFIFCHVPTHYRAVVLKFSLAKVFWQPFRSDFCGLLSDSLFYISETSLSTVCFRVIINTPFNAVATRTSFLYLKNEHLSCSCDWGHILQYINREKMSSSLNEKGGTDVKFPWMLAITLCTKITKLRTFFTKQPLKPYNPCELICALVLPMDSSVSVGTEEVKSDIKLPKYIFLPENWRCLSTPPTDYFINHQLLWEAAKPYHFSQASDLPIHTVDEMARSLSHAIDQHKCIYPGQYFRTKQALKQGWQHLQFLLKD